MENVTGQFAANALDTFVHFVSFLEKNSPSQDETHYYERKANHFYYLRFLQKKPSWENSFTDLFCEAGEWMLQNKHSIDFIQAANMGKQALFFKGQDCGLRLEVGSKVERIDHSLVLQPLWKKYQENLDTTLEIVPLVDTRNVEEKHVLAVWDSLSSNGIQWDDAHSENIGIYQNKWVVIDPGSLHYK